MITIIEAQRGSEFSWDIEPGLLTERGPKHISLCRAMKGVLGDEVGLAVDCRPGWTVRDAVRLAGVVEGAAPKCLLLARCRLRTRAWMKTVPTERTRAVVSVVRLTQEKWRRSP